MLIGMLDCELLLTDEGLVHSVFHGIEAIHVGQVFLSVLDLILYFPKLHILQLLQDQCLILLRLGSHSQNLLTLSIAQVL